MNKYILIFSILISSKLVAQFNPADNNVSQKYYEVMDNISKLEKELEVKNVDNHL